MIDKMKIKVRPLYPAKDVAKMVEDGAPAPEGALLVPKFELKVVLEGDLEDMRSVADYIRKLGGSAARKEKPLGT